jgi:6-phosphogluconolactonase/glucosamine-6-phosphate isomerase/deaminase
MPAAACAQRPSAPTFIQPSGYTPHRSEPALLYCLVEQHYPDLRELWASVGRSLHGRVQEEFDSARVGRELERRGSVDLCILGLGRNGHLGLNEPNPSLQPLCHVATLAEQTRQHTIISDPGLNPVAGMTVGIGDNLRSR